MKGVHPTRCIELYPTPKTISLAGRYISLSEIAREEKIDQSYLSRIMDGERNPTVGYARRIARALGMTTDALLDAIEERKKMIEEYGTDRLPIAVIALTVQAFEDWCENNVEVAGMRMNNRRNRYTGAICIQSMEDAQRHSAFSSIVTVGLWPRLPDSEDLLQYCRSKIDRNRAWTGQREPKINQQAATA